MSTHSKSEVVYSAEPDVAHLGRTFRAMARGMARSPYLGYRLMRKGVKAGYSKSALGMTWDVLDPLVLGCIFYLLMRSRIISPGEMHLPYPLFVIYGLMLYATFVQSLLTGTDLLRTSKGILNHLKVPPEALILSVLFRVFFDSVFRIAVMLLFSLLLMNSAARHGLHAFSPLGFAAFVAAYPIIVMAGSGLGLVLAPLNVLFNDVGRLVKILVTPVRFMTPVLWPIPATGTFFTVVNMVNPVTPLINGLRDLATGGTLTDPGRLAAWSCGYVVVFLVGWFFFHVSVPVLAEKA